MIAILESLRPVIETAKYVKINDDALLKFCEGLSESDLTQPQVPFYELPEGISWEGIVALSIVFNSVNACFWGEPKWAIAIDGKEYGGSDGTVRALVQSVQNGFDILDPNILASLTSEQLQNLFQGATPIPLFEERLKIFRELGRVVLQKYDGKFCNIIARAENNATKLVEILLTDFPSVFNDVAQYHGHEVQFFKRAQLVPTDLYVRSLALSDSFLISGIGQMTALADYKIPMVLREFGILEYAPELAKKVDTKTEIAAGSDEEIEIRASMVSAIDKMKDHLQKRFPSVTAQRVSDIFWTRRREIEKTARPHHRTKTIWY